MSMPKREGDTKEGSPPPFITVRGFPETWTEMQIRLVFAVYGGVASVTFLESHVGRVAYVKLKDLSQTARAVQQLHNTAVGDGSATCTITCELLGESVRMPRETPHSPLTRRSRRSFGGKDGDTGVSGASVEATAAVVAAARAASSRSRKQSEIAAQEGMPQAMWGSPGRASQILEPPPGNWEDVRGQAAEKGRRAVLREADHYRHSGAAGWAACEAGVDRSGSRHRRRRRRTKGSGRRRRDRTASRSRTPVRGAQLCEPARRADVMGSDERSPLLP